MQEYRFNYSPDVPAGRVVFRVRNVGTVNHRLTLLPMADDLPPIDEQLRDSIPQPAAPLAGIPEIPPGQSGTFAVQLEDNKRYAIVCFTEDDNGESHAVKGMSSEFRAGRTNSVVRG